MLKEVLQTLKMLKRIENPSQEVQDSLDFLEQSVKTKTKESLLDLMSIGDVIGYDELQDSLKEMVNFLEKMKNKPQ
ncbi:MULTISPECIES: hypothetical protein [Flavobacteriaceae]|uniref:Uncharacterized protein n=2 Tax=Flagellimonas TaxID=444459 RepID=A0A4S8RMQ6_9FLAO|nr:MULTISPECIES: hypothetical protein [Allomuricauda]MDC6361423.1 hypothetical protein [Muricauda sp. SP22]RYC51179.1 hypothetical protein DN53_16225 [Allomuricauda olearia]THV59340.1 hypothetical protein EZV76_10970 [Allomuricauda alvinocaridis]